MRVLKTLFFSLFWLAIIGGIGFLIAREVLLQIAMSQLTSDTTRLRKIAGNTGVYLQECQKKGSNALDGTLISAIQLRFTSSTEYQIEILCTNYSIDPIIVEQNELPTFVTKVAGGSGFTWGVEPTAVSLELWGRTRSLGILEEKVVLGVTPQDVGTAFSPATSCSGYGFTCCQSDTSIGVGELFTGATDCPRTCHTSCDLRPVILSVTTQPFLDQATRVLKVAKGEEVSIGYVIDTQGLEDTVITVDYGDGQQDQYTEISGFSAHSYACATFSCTYNVTVSAQSANGAVSADTPITKVTIVVQ